jgi:hypothetical protein
MTRSSAMPLGSGRESERGQVLVIFAFVLIALLLVSALAVDYGGWLLTRRNYQNAADQAAIAGAYLLTSQISDQCSVSEPSKNHCAREAAWTSLQEHLGLTFLGATPNAMADSLGAAPYVEDGYSIWVASPPSDAGAAYPGFASSQKTIFVRVERAQQANLSRIIGANPTVGAWATAGRIPQNFAIVVLCGPPDCRSPSGADLKVNGNGSNLILLRGDIGSNSFAKTSGSDAAIALSEANGSSAYMHFPAQCLTTSVSCQLVGWDENTNSRTTRKSGQALPQVIDPAYFPPTFSDTATPWQCRTFGTGSAISAVPSPIDVAADESPLAAVAAKLPVPDPPVRLAAAWPPSGTGIYGQVSDSTTSTGLNNITITATNQTTLITYTTTTSTQNGQAGRYSFTALPPGTYTVLAHDATGAYPDLQYANNVVLNTKMLSLNFSLNPNPGTISGTISGTVTGSMTISTSNGASTTVSSTGPYTIPNVSPGNNLVVTPTPPAGYVSTPASRTVTVTAGQNVTLVDFAISAIPVGTVTGTVTDETTDLPIPSVTVAITTGAGLGKSATTNASGVYTINGVPTGNNQRVTATHLGYTDEVSGNFNVTNGTTTTVNLQMWPDRCGTTNASFGRWDCGYGSQAATNACGTVTNPAAANVSCSKFNQSNVIRPGTYDRITIGANQCAWIDPLGGATGLAGSQSGGVVYVTDQISIGSGAFLFGDGVTIVLGTDAHIDVNNGGGFVINYEDQTGTTYGGGSKFRTESSINDGAGVTRCSGDPDTNTNLKRSAWTTKARYTWDTSVSPPCYLDDGGAGFLGEIGLAFFLRGDAPPSNSHRFDLSGDTGFLFDGVLYGPKDDIGLGGQGDQAAAGQIVAWTLTYSGDTNIIQRYDGLEIDGPPYLIEPYIGE